MTWCHANKSIRFFKCEMCDVFGVPLVPVKPLDGVLVVFKICNFLWSRVIFKKSY